MEPARLFVEPAGGAEVRQLKPAPRILDTVAVHVEGTAPPKFLPEPTEEPFANLGAVVLLQPRPGARLRGAEEVDDILR